MRAYQSAGLAVALAVAAGMLMAAGPSAEQLPLEPPQKAFGQSVWPVYEGWYDNPDGSYTFLVGYFNPNTEETFDIPVGEANHLSPGPPDQGQPTHFATGHGWGVFTVRVPSDFGDKQLRWSITTNNRTQEVPFHLDPQWYVEPFLDAANKNQPPALQFGDHAGMAERGREGGASLQFKAGGPVLEGPPTDIATTLTAFVGQPLELSVLTSDVKPSTTVAAQRRRRFRRPSLVVTWMKFRGPGDVTFGEAAQEFESPDQEVTTTATFSEPGEYILLVEAQDETGSGGGGSQCCWTSAHVKVTVTAGP